MDDFGRLALAFVGSLFALAILNVVVSRNSATGTLISDSGEALTTIISAADSPVTSSVSPIQIYSSYSGPSGAVAGISGGGGGSGGSSGSGGIGGSGISVGEVEEGAEVAALFA